MRKRKRFTVALKRRKEYYKLHFDSTQVALNYASDYEKSLVMILFTAAYAPDPRP
jgi:hypothetical protein